VNTQDARCRKRLLQALALSKQPADLMAGDGEDYRRAGFEGKNQELYLNILNVR
jgi:hypothetical protein